MAAIWRRLVVCLARLEVFLAERKGLTRKQAAAYQGALEAVLAVPIAVGLGYWADRVFGSKPLGLWIGAVIGFGALVLRLTRMRPDIDGDVEEADESEDREDGPTPR